MVLRKKSLEFADARLHDHGVPWEFSAVPHEATGVQGSNPYIHAPPVVLADFADMLSRAATSVEHMQSRAASSGRRRGRNGPAFSTWCVAGFCAWLSRAASP